MHKAFIEPQKESADLIIPWYKMNYIAISVLKASVQDLILEHKD
jgi:uridine kinase